MHHADLEFDVTTGLRFHPIEILLSMVIKLAVVAALGAPALAVLIFEVLLNATSMFNHGNVRIPLGTRPRAALARGDAGHAPRPPLDPVAARPTAISASTCLGGTACSAPTAPQPAAGHEAMTIGIEQFRDPRELRLDRMLLQPFRGDAGRLSARLAGGRAMSAPRIYLDYNASTPIDPAVAAAMRRFLTGHSAIRRAGIGPRRSEERPRDGARPGGGVARLPERRDGFHQRRQRGQQPRPQGRVFRAARQGRSHRHHPDRASGDRRTVPVSRAPGRTGHLSCPSTAPAGSTPTIFAGRSRRARSSSASCTPTTRSAPSSRSRRCAGSPASTASCSTPTPPSPSARSRPR